jgi:hypothetical protein
MNSSGPIPASSARAMQGLPERATILERFGATPGARDELLRYGASGFREPPGGLPIRYPLPDEPFVDAWQEYVRDAGEVGVLPALRDRLVQLRFPVSHGISDTPEYRAATRSGRWPIADDGGVRLHRPDALSLHLYECPAGRIPVLTAAERDDFVTLVQALTRRNEPIPIPESMGACIVAGFNNWDRIARLKTAWIAQNPSATSGQWNQALKRMLPRRDLYQDRFILLSSGPYSGVPAGAIGLTCSDQAFSVTLRREHECAHLFCRRVWGSMRNAVLDEVIADFVGILAAVGRFQADWMLRFFGLDDHDGFRSGGRLQNYLGEPPLSAPAFRVVRRLVGAAAHNLEQYAGSLDVQPGAWQWKVQALTTLPRLSLEALAAFPPNRWPASRPRLVAEQGS